MRIVINLLIMAVVAYGLQMLLSGIRFSSFGVAVVFSVILSLLNLILKPILEVLSFPFTIVTFGLFSLVVNAIVVLLAGYFVEGVLIDGFLWALIFSALLSIVTSFLKVDKSDEK